MKLERKLEQLRLEKQKLIDAKNEKDKLKMKLERKQFSKDMAKFKNKIS